MELVCLAESFGDSDFAARVVQILGEFLSIGKGGEAIGIGNSEAGELRIATRCADL